MIRRWIQSTVVADIERSIRDDLYAHLQRLQASFHDRWQSGQLLSRATTDLSSIRRFAGFGLIFMVTNVAGFIAVVALLINLNWWLGLITGAVFAPVLPVCLRFEKRYKVLSRLGPGPGRRPGDAGRGGGDGHPRPQGAGPQPAGRRQAPRPGRGGLPQSGREGRPARVLLVAARPDPERRHRPHRRPRRVRGQPSLTDAGRPGGLHHTGAAAGLAGRGARLHHRVRPGSGHRRPARAGNLRHGAGDHRQRPESGRTGRRARPRHRSRAPGGSAPAGCGSARPDGAGTGGAGGGTWCSTTWPSAIRARPSPCSATWCST